MTKRIWIPLAGALALGAMRTGHRNDARMDALKKWRYYAHRGLFDAMAGIPENSMAAFKAAKEAGYGIELDVQLAKDGIPVICHDFTLARMCRTSGLVCERTAAELHQLHLCDTGETIPLLKDVLEEIDGEVPLIVELKIRTGGDIAPLCTAVVDLLKDYNGLYCIESFDPRAVRWFYKNEPDVIRGQLYEDIYRKEGEWMYKASANLLFGFLTIPDFIAWHWNHSGILLGPVCRAIWPAMRVCWTIRSEEELQKASRIYDVFIFEGFCPVRA